VVPISRGCAVACTSSRVAGLVARGWSGGRSSPLSVCVLAAIAGIALGPGLAEAQRRSAAITGVVRDSAGAPVVGANVAVVAARALTRTDADGRFTLHRLDPGEAIVSVRRLGFEPRQITTGLRASLTDTLDIFLAPIAYTLEEVRIEGASGRRRTFIEDFYNRRARGIGVYFTRDEIERRHPGRTSDVLRNAPGVRFVQIRGGYGIRFISASVQRRDCIPMIWLDGQRAPHMEVDEIPVSTIEGIELYSGPATTPLQFAQSISTSACGTIVIWTRIPGA
jgi:hypothetical protein